MSGGDGPPRVMILGIGNTILTDDGVGVHAARRAREMLGETSSVVVREAQMGGFALVDLLAGFDRVVVIDALVSEEHAPSTVLVMSEADLPRTLHLVSGHQIDLVTALKLGRELGHPMPADVRIVAVAVADPMTLGEVMTAPVAGSVPVAARLAITLAEEP